MMPTSFFSISDMQIYSSGNESGRVRVRMTLLYSFPSISAARNPLGLTEKTHFSGLTYSALRVSGDIVLLLIFIPPLYF